MMRLLGRLPALPAAILVFLSGCDSSTGPGIPTCETGEGVQLQVGDVAQWDGQDARIVCVTSGSGPGEYVLILFAANPSSNQGIPLALRGEGVQAPATAAAPISDATAGEPLSRTDVTRQAGLEATPDFHFHGELRRLERRALSEKVRPTASAHTAPFQMPALGEVPDPGDLVRLNTRTTEPCENPRYRGGVVKAVSETAIVVADTLNPADGFSDDEYAHFAAAFDTLVGPLGEANFGGVTDLDSNDRVILFFTQDVNRLSEPGSGMFVGGFFFARDLFPREGTARLSPCAHSNEAELLYLMVPDPQGTINGNPRSLAFVERVTLTTMIHELQHLINAAQRLHIVEATTPFEEVWLNEGLSHIAEELLFYETTGLEPGQNLDASDFPAGSPVREFLNRHQIANTFRLEEFLENPDTNSPYNQEDLLPTRGATWHFLRYAADRRGGDQSALFRQLASSDPAGLQNLSDAFATEAVPLSRWFTDWSVALYADDHVPGIEDRFRDRSWNHRSLFGAINQDAEEPFPLRPRQIEHQAVLSASLKGGGAAYFRFSVPSGGTGAVEITTGGGSPPAGLRAVLLRVQ